jgi:molybdopterin molybdotransferase
VLEVHEARRRILEGFAPLGPVEVSLQDAHGRVLAEDVSAPHALQPFDNSAMDGYALRRADVAGASESDPVTLKLIGEVRAGGDVSLEVESGTAARIMTGAPLPPGADAVVPIEQASDDESVVTVRAEPPASGHVRRAGEDVKPGDIVVRAGARVGAGELAVLASLGSARVRVHPAPVVVVVTTGDELVDVTEQLRPGQIRDSNLVALVSLVEEAGATARPYARVADERTAVIDALKRAADESDLVVAAGGVSVGRYDFVKEAVEELGAIDFWRVAMQPGKPVVSGHVSGTPFLGLPGNPVSVHVGFEQFVRPAIMRLSGARSVVRPVVTATLTERIEKPAGRLHFVRVSLGIEDGGFTATPSGPQGSHIQSSLVGCDGLARFPIEATTIEAGERVEVEVWNLPGTE